MADESNVKTYALFANSNNRKLVKDLEKSGAKVFEFPPLRVEKMILEAEAIKILNELSTFDWLILPDVLAADYFLENLEAVGADLFEMDLLRTCTLGEAVADRLRFASVHADVIPATVETEKAFSAIVDYIGENGLENLRFLFPKVVSSDKDLAGKLTEGGAEVIELPVYKTEVTNKLEITRMKTLLKNGAIDEFIFTTPTDFIWLDYYFKSVNLAGVFEEIKVSATDGVVFQTAREYKLDSVSLFHTAKIVKVNE